MEKICDNGMKRGAIIISGSEMIHVFVDISPDISFRHVWNFKLVNRIARVICIASM